MSSTMHLIISFKHEIWPLLYPL